jgi:hypothetical protein
VVVDCGHEKDKNQQEETEGESQRPENCNGQVQARSKEKAGG